MKNSGKLNILIDTNVIIDAVLDRNPNKMDAVRILNDCIERKINGYVTSHSLCDFFYITRKDLTVELRREILLMFANNLYILSETNTEFKKVLEKEFFWDIEDGLQMQCAETASLNYIVTENIKDFTNSTVPAVRIGEFVNLWRLCNR